MFHHSFSINIKLKYKNASDKGKAKNLIFEKMTT